MLPSWLANARTRPIMQMTAVKLDEWFVPGRENKLLARDVAGTRNAREIYENLINPAISNKPADKSNEQKTGTDSGDAKPSAEKQPAETGYKSSERTALENQLLQIETAAKIKDVIDADRKADKESE